MFCIKDVLQDRAPSTTQAEVRACGSAPAFQLYFVAAALKTFAKAVCADMFVLNFSWVWTPPAFWFRVGNLLNENHLSEMTLRFSST